MNYLKQTGNCALKLILGTIGNLIGSGIVETYLETHLGDF